MTEPTKESRLVKATAAAQELGVPYRSLRAIVFRGELPRILIGRAWYFDRQDLARFINDRKEIVGSAG